LDTEDDRMLVENLVFAAFTALSLSLLAISVLAYKRSASRKMLILSVVFFLFLAKGILISVSLLVDLMGLYELLIVGSGLDTFALLVLYGSTMRV
jgi:hypothetical protein